jgi:hypothetical protein
MDATVATPASRSASRRRNRWSQLLLYSALAALVLALGFYTTRYFSSSSFHEARAFRVLEEVGGQFDNLQQTLTNLLSAMNDQLRNACIPGAAGYDKVQCKTLSGAYADRLALRGAKPAVVSVNEQVAKLACANATDKDKRQIFIVSSRGADTRYQASMCDARSYGLTGQLAQSVDAYISQTWFDEVLLVLADGTVIVDTLSQDAKSGGNGRSLHPATRSHLNLMNASDLLRRARRELETTATSERTDADKAALQLPPAQSVAFSQPLAGETYRVFVRTVRPGVPLYMESATGDIAQRDVLYLVGLKHYDFHAEVAGALGPVGRFTITVLVLLALLAWPIANVRSKSASDAITWSEVVACLVSLLMIPAVFAIAAVCVWGYQATTRWADDGASTYGQQLATALSNELGRDAELLTMYRRVYENASGNDCEELVSAFPAPLEPHGSTIAKAVAKCPIGDNCPDEDSCVVSARAQTAGAPDYRNWSPFSSVFATSREGSKVGLRLTAFDAPQTSKNADYSTRAYFRSLRDGRSWSIDADDGRANEFVGQRIFSMTDGARMLQLAVPLFKKCDTGEAQCFDGIVSGGGRVHALAAAVAPPLLRFAVIDRYSGSVIFHSDDSRSVAENFFVETEQDADLLAAVQLGRAEHFYGHYMGDDKRFYFLPMDDVPWGIVVMYSLQDIGDVSWHAGLTALAAYAGVVLLLAMFLACALVIVSMRRKSAARELASWLWHDRRGWCIHTRAGAIAFGSLLVTVILYELLAAPGKVSSLTWWMIVPFVVLVAALRWQHTRKSPHACLAICLLLVSCLPAAWMALGYHELQLQALLRDGLVTASRDIDRRQTIIDGDLRRWVRSESDRKLSFPDAWALTVPTRLMPVPGYELGSCTAPDASSTDWHLCVFGPSPLAGAITPRPLDFWRRATWDAAAHSDTQNRRIRLLDTNIERLPRCTSAKGIGEQCEFIVGGHAFSMVANSERSAVTAAMTDAQGFVATSRAVVNFLAVLATLFATWLLAAFATRRLFARVPVSLPRTSGDPTGNEVVRGVVFYRLKPAMDYRLYLRPPGPDQWLPAIRVDLVCDAALESLEEAGGSAPYILEDLDIALIDGARRKSLLATLEKLLANPDVQLIITCSRSPLDRLYHPERFTESSPDNAVELEECLRWDRVLEQFNCDVRRVPVRRHDSAELRKVDHHQAWKLCTRAERLLLHQIATGHLPNPASPLVADLAARGLIDTQAWPWPTIADPEFEQFVRSAERESDLAEWRREDARAAGKPTRRIIIAVLLLVMVIAVLWFSWTAGDQFRVISAIVAAAVAFLGQIGQAFNFVRSGSGSK